jgi:hypothetical protein
VPTSQPPAFDARQSEIAPTPPLPVQPSSDRYIITETIKP